MSATESTRNCRDCEAPIFWGITAQGKRIPLDAAHQLVFLSTGGIVDGAVPVEQKRGYTIHFATCPKAKPRKSPAMVQLGGGIVGSVE